MSRRLPKPRVIFTALVLICLYSPILLVLVFSTVGQMRPTSVIRAIHDRALSAREEEAALLRATRRESTSATPSAIVDLPPPASRPVR